MYHTGLWRLCAADMDALDLLIQVTMVKPRHPHHAFIAPLPPLSGILRFVTRAIMGTTAYTSWALTPM